MDYDCKQRPIKMQNKIETLIPVHADNGKPCRKAYQFDGIQNFNFLYSGFLSGDFSWTSQGRNTVKMELKIRAQKKIKTTYAYP